MLSLSLDHLGDFTFYSVMLSLSLDSLENPLSTLIMLSLSLDHLGYFTFYSVMLSLSSDALGNPLSTL